MAAAGSTETSSVASSLLRRAFRDRASRCRMDVALAAGEVFDAAAEEFESAASAAPAASPGKISIIFTPEVLGVFGDLVGFGMDVGVETVGARR